MLKKNIKIDRSSMELISLFNNISGAIIKDCLVFKSPENYGEIIIFLVKKQDVGKAIGKSAAATNNPRPGRIQVISALSVSPTAAKYTYKQKRDFWEEYVYGPGLLDYERSLDDESSNDQN